AMLASQRRGDGLCAASGCRCGGRGASDCKRRGNSPPRRWWHLCVAPYFATLGRGDMRGRCAGRSTQSHPGGGAGLSLPSWWDVYCCVSVVYFGTMTACHHLRGGIFVGGVGGPRMSPTPRSAKYGATHSGNPSRGGENVRLRSSSLPVA
ncbi:MAG: hypothetical protein SO127_08030, partial [Muribaculaceae bacterium]|nr:hypothetical protein [Muribaculaceae bacterium]